MKYFIIVTVLILVVFSAIVLFDHFSNKLIIVNESNQTISTLTVKIKDRRYQFVDLKPNTTVSCRFTVDGDSNYVVEGQLEDGTLVKAEDWYVSNGMMGVRTRIGIGAQGVVDIEDLGD